MWGPGVTASSDGQRFRAGGTGEQGGQINLRYGTEPGVLFYTHISDRFAPFHTKVINANVRDVLDGLLYHESDLRIEEHYTDTAGFTDHVFAMMSLLGFRFAPRIRDLADKPADRSGVSGPHTTDSAHSHKIAENWLAKVPAPDRPGSVWQREITYIETAEGWLYLAFTLDACSGRVLAHHCREDLLVELTTTTFDLAAIRQRPPAGLIHHSVRFPRSCGLGCGK